MQVIIHAGAHCTESDRLLKCLLRNADLLRDAGSAVPGPSRYRTLLLELVNALSNAVPHPDARAALLDEILDGDGPDPARLVLSHPNFFSVPKLAFDGGAFYPKAEERLARLAALFEGDSLTLCLALRDPATLIPALIAETPHATAGSVLQGVDPAALRWSDLLARIRAALPDLAITVWCNEDSPLIWGTVVRAVGGLAPDQKITGAFDVFTDIVTEEGRSRFRAFLKDNPGVNEAQKRRVMTAFLERYALPEAVEEEVDVPDWSADLVASLTAAYDADLDRIAAIPGVRLILP